MRRQTGFTLLEVVVAAAIFAFIGLASFAMLNAAQKGQLALESNTDRLLELQRAFRIMTYDIGQAIQRSSRDEYGDRSPLFVGLSDRNGTQSFMEFTRAGWRNPIGLPRSSLQRLRYQMNQDNQLLRLHWTYLDRASGSEPNARVLLEGVESIDFRFLYQTSSWQEEWPDGDATQNSLPRAVLVTLQLDDYDEITRILRVGG